MLMIAFGHEKNVGKDTAARFLCSYLRTTISGSNIQTVGFADKVKDIAYQLYSWAGLRPGWFYDQPEHHKLKEVILPLINKTPRDCWLHIGNRLRDLYEDTWVDYVAHNIKADICIIKDMRFPVEAARINSHDGFVFKIERPSVEHTSDEADDALIGYQHWTDTIINDGSLKAFNEKVMGLAIRYILPYLGDKLSKEANV